MASESMFGQITIRASEEQLDALRETAAAERRSVSQVVRFALEEYVERRARPSSPGPGDRELCLELVPANDLFREGRCALYLGHAGDHSIVAIPR